MTDDALQARHQQLLLRSAQLRSEVSQQAQAFRRPLALADTARDGVQWLYRNPVWVLAGLALLVAVRPRRVLALGASLWWAWRTLQKARRWLHALPGQPR